MKVSIEEASKYLHQGKHKPNTSSNPNYPQHGELKDMFLADYVVHFRPGQQHYDAGISFQYALVEKAR